MKTKSLPLKRNLDLKRIMWLLIPFMCSLKVVMASGPIAPNLFFSNPVLQSGTALQQGAVYKFSTVATGVDALVKIDTLRNGATVINIDQTAVGYDGAFQPIVQSQQGFTNSYAVFKISFVTSIGGLPKIFTNVAATALDIDGNATLKEYAIIDMNGGTATYSNATPQINLISWGTGYKGINTGGIDLAGIDTLNTNVMFTVKNANISSFMVKFGAEITSGGASQRNYSVFLKDFTSSSITLPIKLSSFSAILYNHTVDLKWITSAEINTNYFEVERSVDGKNYSSIGIISSAGNSNTDMKYNYQNDITSFNNGIIYYRLKIVDKDGSVSYSPVRIIRLAQDKKGINLTVYPNPVANELRVTIPSAWQNRPVQLELFNGNGQKVKELISANSSQTETIQVSDISRGIYFIKASSGNETAQQRFLKN